MLERIPVAFLVLAGFAALATFATGLGILFKRKDGKMNVRLLFLFILLMCVTFVGWARGQYELRVVLPEKYAGQPLHDNVLITGQVYRIVISDGESGIIEKEGEGKPFFFSSKQALPLSGYFYKQKNGKYRAF